MKNRVVFTYRYAIIKPEGIAQAVGLSVWLNHPNQSKQLIGWCFCALIVIVILNTPFEYENVILIMAASFLLSRLPPSGGKLRVTERSTTPLSFW